MIQYKVHSIFGPTLQGEGPEAGKICNFIRFGGCDYSCFWCDSKDAAGHAGELPWYSVSEILDLVDMRDPALPVVLTGGNPVLWDLDPLVRKLKDTRRVSVETQGSIYKPWLSLCDTVIVSPKPPSSGNSISPGVVWTEFLSRPLPLSTYIKITVFDEKDLKYAYNFGTALNSYVGRFPLYLSCGKKGEYSKEKYMARYSFLSQKVLEVFSSFSGAVHFLPQLHVLADLE